MECSTSKCEYQASSHISEVCLTPINNRQNLLIIQNITEVLHLIAMEDKIQEIFVVIHKSVK